MIERLNPIAAYTSDDLAWYQDVQWPGRLSFHLF
jgi:hypothetical protein